MTPIARPQSPMPTIMRRNSHASGRFGEPPLPGRAHTERADAFSLDAQTASNYRTLLIIMTVDPALTCPRCNLPLKQVSISGRMFWGCDLCGGRAVTVALLRRTFTRESINPLWLHAVSGQGRSSCPCPSCRHPMTEVALAETAGVKVDVCRHCQFVWFDPHEVDSLKPKPPPKRIVPAPEKARQILALEKVRQLTREADHSDFTEWWRQLAGFFGLPPWM